VVLYCKIHVPASVPPQEFIAFLNNAVAEFEKSKGIAATKDPGNPHEFHLQMTADFGSKTTKEVQEMFKEIMPYMREFPYDGRK
jgi:hypothetical protein